MSTPAASSPGAPDETTDEAVAPRASRLAWVLVAVLLAATIALSVLLVSARATTEPAVRGAAVAFMTELTTWDATDGLEDTTEALRAMGTGAFLDEVDEVLGGEIQATAEALGATSRGEVTEVVVDGTVVIVFVRQTLDVRGVTEVTEQIARLELLEVDGQWKVAVVELLNAPVPLQGGDQ